ncbi:hypothetical protein DFH09DRAFT_1130845 [Mycena vulgaris]|nr:hypothetical protein DFH09DRAFT_1130845 [Mycena vulgaris]
MPIGEVPITSYFTRVPQKKKRKKNPETHSASAKRRRLVDAEDGEPAKKEVKVQGSLTFPKAPQKIAPARTTSRRGVTTPRPSSRDESRLLPHVVAPRLPDSSATNILEPSEALHTPRSPSVGSNDPHSLIVGGPSSLSSHTPAFSRLDPPAPPPMAQGDATKRKSVAFASPSSASGFHHATDASDHAHNVVHDAAWGEPPDEDDAPSLSIVPSSQSQYISSPTLPSPSLPEPFNLFTPGSQSDASQLDASVPSSQSQYTRPPKLSLRRWNGNDDTDLIPSSQSQYIIATTAPVQRDDDGFVVPSSQSQWLLPVELDGEGNCRPTSSPDGTTSVADDEAIPSSQSQFELELTPWNGPARERSPSLRPTSGGEPDLDIDVEDMFENPLATTDGVLGQDDSATESDDDVPAPPRAFEPIPSPSPEHAEYSTQSGFASGDIQSIPDDGFGSAASSGSSLGSLPSAVKDFYDMFGSGDSSYPEDFPQSLKWTGGETQESGLT